MRPPMINWSWLSVLSFAITVARFAIDAMPATMPALAVDGAPMGLAAQAGPTVDMPDPTSRHPARPAAVPAAPDAPPAPTY